MPLDLAYIKSVPVLLPHYNRIHFVLIGAGGTGSFLASAIARLMLEIESSGDRACTCTIVDPDTVEVQNIPRQNFQAAEIGLFKAEVLAMRYALALGCRFEAISRPFESEIVRDGWNQMTIAIGCVDNATARTEISYCLNYNSSQKPPRIWWLDCGNHPDSGQVLLGSDNHWSVESAFDCLQTPNFCIRLPSPSLLHPELLLPLPEELSATKLSCAQIAERNRQSLFVNQQVAAIASDYLLALTLTGSLKRFATYFNSNAGCARSLYTSPETFASLTL